MPGCYAVRYCQRDKLKLKIMKTQRRGTTAPIPFDKLSDIQKLIVLNKQWEILYSIQDQLDNVRFSINENVWHTLTTVQREQIDIAYTLLNEVTTDIYDNARFIAVCCMIQNNL